MKKLFLILLVCTGMSSYSQNIKDKIQGNWVCIKILNSMGEPTAGKFGDSSKYLRISFDKDSFSLSQAPFDKGIPIKLVLKNDYSFDCAPEAKFNFPEKHYKIEEVDEKKLLLSTKSEKGDIFYYYFANQNLFPVKQGIVDLGVLLIKHIVFSKDTKKLNRICLNNIQNNASTLAPCPLYINRGEFGHELSNNMKLPKDFKLNEISPEFLLDFDVSEKGAENIKVTGDNEEINDEIIRVMGKLKPNWKPVVTSNQVKITLRFHLYFYKPVELLRIF